MAPPSRTRNMRLFDSVFASREISQPTPHAPPPPPGRNWGGPEDTISRLKQSSKAGTERIEPELSDVRGSQSRQGNSAVESKHVADQVRWDRSWHIVTYELLLPPFPRSQNSIEPLKPQIESLDGAFYRALADVLDPATQLPYARHTEDIIVWHTQQFKTHFLNQVVPIIHHLTESHENPDDLIYESIQVLETAHIQYLHGVGLIKDQLDSSTPNRSMPVLAKFQRNLHAVISNSLIGHLSDALHKVLERYVFMILGLPPDNDLQKTKILPESRRSEDSRREFLELIRSLKNVGLAGEKLQVTFAEIMNTAMKEYVQKAFKGVWSSDGNRIDIKDMDKAESILPRAAHLSYPSQSTTELCEWIENRYAKLAVQVLNSVDVPTTVTWANKEKFKEIGIGHLAELRIQELFDIVLNSPNTCGALDDLRTAITTPQRRLHLTESFAKALNEKLLHPGASTLQILQTYISMIWSFHSLDHSKVLLDRVAYPLQIYLCSREDTVRIIIAGLLAGPGDPHAIGSTGDKLMELAALLNAADQKGESRSNYDGELDWHDMEWVPDPVDAGPGYKRSKDADIIGTLIGALGTSDVFIKEFQNILGEHLLKNDTGFEREVKVLELLKTRFGEAPLQACEVMLNDIQDSNRVNNIIRRDQALEPGDEEINIARSNPSQNLNPEGLQKPSLHAKILSRHFWLQLQNDSYRIPAEIAFLQKAYEEGFETLKSARKLTWLHALGQATVELELEDRTVLEEVHTWQATVIWAFQSEDGLEVSHTVQGLIEHLEMEEPLILSALKFWINKLVLHEPTPGVYTVLETLNASDRALSASKQANPNLPSNDETEETSILANEVATSEKMQMYWQFIQGMLKNSRSQMPLQQIAMMLKMLIAEGFPYSNEELMEFLAVKVQEGELELQGGKYRLPK